MAKRSKDKGNSFERKVAADILLAAGPGFGRKDCYRTPMSGGHKYAGQGDLVVSEALQKVIPFVVECKHQKAFRTSHLFFPTEIVRSYHRQVLEESNQDPFERLPLLVMRGKDNETYAALLRVTLESNGFGMDGRDVVPLLHYHCEGCLWVAMPWDRFLELVKEWAGNDDPTAPEDAEKLSDLLPKGSVKWPFSKDVVADIAADKLADIGISKSLRRP